MALTGHAAIDVRHVRYGDGASNRGERAAILAESMRELDTQTMEVFAQKNPNIVVGDGHLNVAMVNNGVGGFAPCIDREEVLAYGDERAAQVHRKIQKRSFATTLLAVHLPKTMCKEVPNFYPRTNKDGSPRTDEDGNPLSRSRYVARDRDEAIAYFEKVVEFIGDEVLWGGQAAIHGWDINFDESTPHIQIMADTFAPDPNREGELRVCASQMWGDHKDVRYGEEDGPDKAGKQMHRKAKMKRMQEKFRTHMHGLGYEVELELSERHQEKLSKESFAELGDDRAELEALRTKFESLQSDLSSEQSALYVERAELEHEKTESKFELEEAKFLTGLEEKKRRDLERRRSELANEIDVELPNRRKAYIKKVNREAKAIVDQAEKDAEGVKAAAQQEATRIVSENQAAIQQKVREVIQEAEDEAASITAAAKKDRQAAADELLAAKAHEEEAAQALKRVEESSYEEAKAILAEFRNDLLRDRLDEQLQSVNFKIRQQFGAKDAGSSPEIQLGDSTPGYWG